MKERRLKRREKRNELVERTVDVIIVYAFILSNFCIIIVSVDSGRHAMFVTGCLYLLCRHVRSLDQ